MGLVSSVLAVQGRNQGAVNNLCQNLTLSCREGEESSCRAFKEVGCKCDGTMRTCPRGN